MSMFSTGLPSLAGGIYGAITNAVPDEYKTVIRVKSTDSSVNGVTLLAHTPQEINFQIDGNWNEKGGTIGEWGNRNGQPGLGRGITSESMRDLISTTTGLTEFNKYLTAPVWGGTSPLHLQLSFDFRATFSPPLECWVPGYFLAALAAPYEFLNIPGLGLPTGMLHAPGPTILPSTIFGEAAGILSALQGDIIDIYIGRMLAFKKVILRNANVNIINAVYVGNKSVPINVRVDVEFQTYFVTTRQDLAEIMHVSSFGSLMAAGVEVVAAAGSAAKEAANLGAQYLV